MSEREIGSDTSAMKLMENALTKDSHATGRDALSNFLADVRGFNNKLESSGSNLHISNEDGKFYFTTYDPEHKVPARVDEWSADAPKGPIDYSKK